MGVPPGAPGTAVTSTGVSVWWTLPPIAIAAGLWLLARLGRALVVETRALALAARRLDRIAVAGDETERAVARLRLDLAEVGTGRLR